MESQHFYARVLPRDLFNEAKLLKCLGFLTLHIHDNLLHGLSVEFDGEAFKVDLSESGELYCSNISFWIGTRFVSFYSNYNDKSPFPLHFCVDDEIGAVFEDDGTYTSVFRNLLSGGRDQ